MMMLLLLGSCPAKEKTKKQDGSYQQTVAGVEEAKRKYKA
jgi:hypothetical protein